MNNRFLILLISTKENMYTFLSSLSEYRLFLSLCLVNYHFSGFLNEEMGAKMKCNNKMQSNKIMME